MRENPRTLTWIFIFVAVMSAAAVVIAALISSAKPPQPLSTLPSTPPTSQQLIQPTSSAGSLLFFEDFEDGRAQKIAEIHGNWKIVTENNGNKAYDIDNSNGSGYPAISFGSTAWRNYAIEYSVKFLSGKDPEAILEFRRSSDALDKYVVSLDRNAINLYFTRNGIGWQPIVAYEYSLASQIWHFARVEVQGEKIKVYVDKLLTIDTDDSQISQGNVLISVSPGTHAEFDDIRVTALGE